VIRLALLLVLLPGCAALRTGWVQVDFVTGKPTDLMVCTMKVARDGDNLTGKCADYDDMAEGLAAYDFDRKIKQVREGP